MRLLVFMAAALWVATGHSDTEELSENLSVATSVAELASLLARVDASYCSAIFIAQLDALHLASPSDTEQAALVDLKEYCASRQHFAREYVPLGVISSAVKQQSQPVRSQPVLSAKFQQGTVARPQMTKQQLTRLQRLLSNPRLRCRPRPTLVPLPTPPDGTVYTPSCVSVRRCGGCCGKKVAVCRATNTTTVKRTVAAVDVSGRTSGVSFKSLLVEQHTACRCGCKVQASDCSSKHRYDGDSCKCRCRNASEIQRCAAPRVWDDAACECRCERNPECSTGSILHQASCR